MDQFKKPEETQRFIQKQLGIIRKEQSLTQEELAFLLKLTPKTISDIENNRRGISVKTLIKICLILKINIANIFNNKNE